jgi:hypothetical protein
MLEITQEILERVDPLLDAGVTESAGRLLTVLDRISLRALLVHVLRERGAAVAETIAATYLVASADNEQRLGERPAGLYGPVVARGLMTVKDRDAGDAERGAANRLI